jgi:hypothetical protein
MIRLFYLILNMVLILKKYTIGSHRTQSCPHETSSAPAANECSCELNNLLSWVLDQLREFRLKEAIMKEMKEAPGASVAR